MEIVIENPTKLIDLNTECFIELFQYLSYKDLFNLNCVHSRFFDAIEYVIGTSVSNNLTLSINFDDKNFRNELELLKRYLALFGRRMKCLKLKLEGSNWMHYRLCQRDLQKAILVHCTNGNVKHCSFDNFLVEKRVFKMMLYFFSELLTLELVYSADVGKEYMFWLMHLVAVGELRIFKCSPITMCKLNFNILHCIAASQLETCVIDLCRHIDYEIDELPVNETVKHLDLGRISYDPAILEYFPNIEHLRYNNVLHLGYSLQPISDLTKLKRFELSGSLTTECLFLLSELANRNHLESFTYHEWYPTTEVFDIICRMTNLTELCVNLTVKDCPRLPQLGHNLKNLRTISIHLIDDNKFDAVMSTILEFVKVAKCLIQLKLAFLFGKLGYHQKLYENVVDIRQTNGFTDILLLKFFNCSEIILASEEQRRFVYCKGESVFMLRNLKFI